MDAFDFSDYTAAVARAHEHLKAELSKIKAGGRNAGEIEGLRVVFGKKKEDGGGGEKGGGGGKGKGKGRAELESVKLGDVASVVARGRNIGVLVGEKDVRSVAFSCPTVTNIPHPSPPRKGSRRIKQASANPPPGKNSI